MSLDELMKAIWDRGNVVTAKRMHSNSVSVQIASNPNRWLHVFDEGYFVGLQVNLASSTDEVHELDRNSEAAIEWLLEE